jgi:hypothetical protein
MRMLLHSLAEDLGASNPVRGFAVEIRTRTPFPGRARGRDAADGLRMGACG